MDHCRCSRRSRLLHQTSRRGHLPHRPRIFVRVQPGAPVGRLARLQRRRHHGVERSRQALLLLGSASGRCQGSGSARRSSSIPRCGSFFEPRRDRLWGYSRRHRMKRYSSHSCSMRPANFRRKVTWFGRNGLRRSSIPASSGVRLPLRLLHRTQAATRFSHVSPPPRDFGITWSIVRGGLLVPQ